MIIQADPIDNILETYRVSLGKAYEGYRGHCYRLLNYMELLGLRPEERRIAELAIPFHDLGVWVYDTMDYLEPSVDLAREYLSANNIQTDIDSLETMIRDHHKLTRSRDPLAEKLRKADLIDLSLGKIRFGLPKTKVRSIRNAFPDQGFIRSIYWKVTRNAFRHPRKPFPMLRR